MTSIYVHFLPGLSLYVLKWRKKNVPEFYKESINFYQNLENIGNATKIYIIWVYL